MNLDAVTPARSLFILGGVLLIAGMATNIQTPWFEFSLATPFHSFMAMVIGLSSIGGGVWLSRNPVPPSAATQEVDAVHQQPVAPVNTAGELLAKYTKLTRTQQMILDYVIQREVVNWREVHDNLFPEKDRADAVYRALHLVHLGFLQYEHVGRGGPGEKYVYRLTPEFKEFAEQADDQTMMVRPSP